MFTVSRILTVTAATADMVADMEGTGIAIPVCMTDPTAIMIILTTVPTITSMARGVGVVQAGEEDVVTVTIITTTIDERRKA